MIYLRVLAASFLCLMLVACNNDNAHVGVVLNPQPKTIPVNEYFALNIGLTDEKYKNIKPSDIHIEAIMPSHGHGMNVQPVVTTTEQEGNYHAEGLLFHMRGDWEVIVYVDLGGSVDKITFNATI